jgi:glycosyltransferase involved in cell wall biosynthesis
MLGPEFLDYTPSFRRKDDKFRFIAIGTLLPRKGFDLLIKAFAASALTDRECSLSIIGEGPERPVLEQIIAECNVTESVHLLGRKIKTEIVQALRDSDVFVLSSRAETFGVVCIEAQSQGLPCVATVCGGPEEFITEKDGVLVPPENQEELTRAMIYVYNNYSKYNRAEISAQCIGRFSPRVIATQLTGIFEDLVSNYK